MLPAVVQRVTIYGDRRNTVALIPHALTGSSRVADWWPGIVGESALFDPRDWCIVGINALGSCYGSTGPTQYTPFPRITVADIVRAQRHALSQLGIERLDVVIGGSFGGMQALQWALDAPDRIAHAIVIGAHDHHSPMGIALNAVQRDALALDPVRGLRLARKIATLTYKSEELFNARHSRRADRSGKARFDIEGYLERQADVFESRMPPATYTTLTHAMDSFEPLSHRERSTQLCHPERSAEGAESKDANNPILTFVGITSDWLFRAQDVRAAADRFRAHGFDARYVEFASDHGHDAFLAESHALAQLLTPHAKIPAFQREIPAP